MPTHAAIVEALLRSTPRDTEERALVAVACRNRSEDVGALLRTQLSTGAWSAGPVAAPGNCYHTALALLAIRSLQSPGFEVPVKRGFAWLDSVTGLESHWLWKWKFRYFDRHVRFDTSKNGWPWVEGTVSWVAPTAMVLLAHRACQRSSPRLRIAEEMLLDRACPAGGWNAGNPEVLGVPLDPHPDFTAMALLALRGVDSPAISAALNYLGGRLQHLTSLYSLGWAVVALNCWQHPTGRSATQQLATARFENQPIRGLAVAALALEHYFGGAA